MAFTRPTTDQVNFRSSKTGTHLLRYILGRLVKKVTLLSQF